MSRVLALNTNGDITWCVASEENRGKGRCNHIAHQNKGESTNDFIKRVNNSIKVESYEMPENLENIKKKVVEKYGIKNDPNWENVVKSIQNPFVIGKEEDGSYEEAQMVGFDTELIESSNGNMQQLTATYLFRGREFKCDFGKVPAVNPNGTLTIDGVDWRVLPVLEQNKAGVISYYDNIVIKQEDSNNIAIQMSKDPSVDTAKVYGITVPIDNIENFLQNGDITGLTSGQIYALSHIDPISFERFPNLATNLRDLKKLPPDEVGDITWRRCIRYEDIVRNQMKLQMRRMGVTFRTNLSKRQDKFPEDPMNEVLDEKFPLFYQVNLTENIKRDLIGRSNVQHSDDLNPISALSQSQKISLTGPGGFNKDKVAYEARMPHDSHRGIIDSMDVSSGKNVGLTMTLSNGYIGEDRFIHKKPGPKPQKGPSDFIPFKYHDDPNRANMAVAHMKQACPILGGEDPIPLGDPLSDESWKEISGSKLGKNLLVAYIPMKYNFEDAVLLSQSAADSMSTVQNHTYKCKDRYDNKMSLSTLKIGDRVERKMVIGGEEIKNGGVITAIDNENNSFTVETTYKMTPGDKLAGRHGNKSVVSKVLSDDEMPKIINPKTGRLEPAQVVMSPLSVAGRKNLGQIMETNKTYAGSADINIKQKVVLSDGHQIEATAGKQYILRLNHIAEKKLSSHAEELDSKREAKGARIGEMESILLSTDEDRLRVLNYLRHQEAYDSHKKLHSLLKAIGVDISGVNWDD